MSQNNKPNNPQLNDISYEQEEAFFQQLCSNEKFIHVLPNIIIKDIQQQGNLNLSIKQSDEINANIILQDINMYNTLQTINNYTIGSNELLDLMIVSMYSGEESIFYIHRAISKQLIQQASQFYAIKIKCTITESPTISLIKVAGLSFNERFSKAEEHKDKGNQFYTDKNYDQAQKEYINALVYLFYSPYQYKSTNELIFLSLDGPTTQVTELRYKIRSNLGLVYQKQGCDKQGIMQFNSLLLEMKKSGIWTEDAVNKVFKRLGLFPMLKENIQDIQDKLKQVEQFNSIQQNNDSWLQEFGIDDNQVQKRTDDEIKQSYNDFNDVLKKQMPLLNGFIAQNKKQQDQMSKRFMKGLVESSASLPAQQEKKRDGPVIITDDGKGNKQSNTGQPPDEKKKTSKEKLESAELKKNYAKMFIQAKRWEEAIDKYKEALYETIDDLQFPCITAEEKEKEVNKIRDYGEEGLTDDIKKIIEMRCMLFSNLQFCYQKIGNYHKVVEYGKICIGNQINNNIILPNLLLKICEKLNIAYKETKDIEEQNKLAKQYAASNKIQNNEEARQIIEKYLQDAQDNIVWLDEQREKEYMAMIRKRKQQKTESKK